MDLMLVLYIGAAALTWAATGAVLDILRKRQILDNPNERSSHTLPTPRGGGWGIMAAVLPGTWLAASLSGASAPGLWLCAGMILLMWVSWFDDMRGVSAKVRFGVMILAVVLGYQALPDGMLIFQGLVPAWLEALVIGFGWLWFINLYNFMDGIDGITGVETLSIATGAAAVALVAAQADGMSPIESDALVPFLACVLGGAAVGFLIWNWHPSKLFMGDIGSVPLGFVLAALLLVLAAEGQLAAAIILPMYYLFDATYTLLKRIVKRERFWEAHRQHFYQIACAGKTDEVGRMHDKVSLKIGGLNILLIVCAILSIYMGWVMVPVALLLTVGLCWHFRQLSRS